MTSEASVTPAPSIRLGKGLLRMEGCQKILREGKGVLVLLGSESLPR